MIYRNKVKVLDFLKGGNTITAMNGFEQLKIVSVRDYISMLKKDGVPIQSEWRKSPSGKRYKAYWLEKESASAA